MGKEIDTYKISRLFDAFHVALLWCWYLIAVVIGTALWFFQVPQTRIQVFIWATIFIFYTLLSVLIKKLASIRTEIG